MLQTIFSTHEFTITFHQMDQPLSSCKTVPGTLKNLTPSNPPEFPCFDTVKSICWPISLRKNSNLILMYNSFDTLLATNLWGSSFIKGLWRKIHECNVFIGFIHHYYFSQVIKSVNNILRVSCLLVRPKYLFSWLKRIF